MNLKRQVLAAAAVAGAVAIASLSNSHAQQYPTRPVRLIAPFPPGGGTDILSRLLAVPLSQTFGQPVIVDNRPGAGGAVGAEITVRAEPDGHTLCLVSSSYAATSAYRKLTYDPVNDIQPIILLGTVGLLMTAHPSLPAASVKELIAYAQANPGRLNYASVGVGSVTHLSYELFNQMAKVNIVHVPYKGGGPAVTDIIGGHVQFMFEVMPQLLPHVQARRLKALGISSPERSKAIPTLPTIAEQGMPGFQSSTWFGILAPAGTPEAAVNRLNAEFAKALAEPDIAKRIADLGATSTPNSPADYARFLRADLEKWRQVVAKSGAKFD
jgi:tripartite-type tricarboxylate transporter receptor subunit TctC